MSVSVVPKIYKRKFVRYFMPTVVYHRIRSFTSVDSEIFVLLLWHTQNMPFGMRIRLKVCTLRITQMHMIDGRHFHVHATAGGDFNPVQALQLMHRSVRKSRKQFPIDCELEFAARKCDGQLELLVDEERKNTVAFFGAESTN